MILAVALVICADWYVFPESVSRSGTYGVGWRVSGRDLHDWKWDDDTFWGGFEPGDNSENWLVKVKEGKAIARLHGLAAFPHENHGGLEVRYSKDERYVAAVHVGKWFPRAFVVADTQTGKQTDALVAIQRDARHWIKHHNAAYWRTNHDKLVYDVTALNFVGRRLVLDVDATVPRWEDCTMQITYAVLSGPHLKLLSIKATKPS